MLLTRNMATMSKHRVHIMKPSGQEGTGNGLFTDADMPMGTNMPAKGVWFSGINQLNKWLNEQHPLTAQAMSWNVVEVHFSTPPEVLQVSY